MSNLKLKVLNRIMESGLVAVVRADSSDQAARIAEACAAGGVAAVEITFTVPGTAGVISDLAKQYRRMKSSSAPEQCWIRRRHVSRFSPAPSSLSAPRESGGGAALQSISDSVHARAATPREVIEAMECARTS
jgi:hypothetical protein